MEYLKRVAEYIGIMIAVILALILCLIGIGLFGFLVSTYGIWGFFGGLVLFCFIMAAFG